MAQNLHKPTRMCIVCRQRFMQKSLIRLQCIEGSLELFTGVGRSFYVCEICVEHKKTPGHLSRQCKSGGSERLLNRLKEIIVQ